MVLHNEVINEMASRKVRLHHFLWHQIRNTWSQISETQKQELKNLGWEPGRSSRTENGIWLTLNGSGEDFLFMHRQMIKKVREITEKNNGDMDAVTGWRLVPGPSSSDWPVPETWEVYGASCFNSFLKAVKADYYYWVLIREWERTYQDEAWLKGRTLGEVGAIIESTIHNMMHMRWCSRPWDARTGKPEPTTGKPDNEIGQDWDDPQYDWLGDSYSSHVNPVFWKLHGWVDDRIEDWYRANEADLSPIDIRGIRWYKGNLVTETYPWSGAMDFGNEHNQTMIKSMEEAAKVVLDLPRYTFYPSTEI
jgi:hypothetical protein